MALVALRFDGAARPLRGGKLRQAAKAVPLVSRGYVFRNEKPGPGRFRQFMQFDADTVGSASIAADAEMCMMAADTLEALGIARGDYVIKVNNRKILDGVMEAIGLAGPDNAARRLIVLRAMDKFDKFGAEACCCCSAPAVRTSLATSPKARGWRVHGLKRCWRFLMPGQE